jgi:hypothetical protein
MDDEDRNDPDVLREVIEYMDSDAKKALAYLEGKGGRKAYLAIPWLSCLRKRARDVLAEANGT